MVQIESLLSARLFLSPQAVGDRIYFVSNLSGHLSLYAMDAGGSVPEPLLPASIALQNPELIGGYLFYVFPKLGKILVMIDRDGDENYQPMLVPVDGGIPEPAFGATFANFRVHCSEGDPERNLVYFSSEVRGEARSVVHRGDLATGEVTQLAESHWGNYYGGGNADHSRVIILEGYTTGDEAVFEWTPAGGKPRLLYGVPLDARTPGQEVPLNSIAYCWYTPQDRGLIFLTSLFEDTYGPGYLELTPPGTPQPVTVTGTAHHGVGEMVSLRQIGPDRYLVGYNIEGESWYYEGAFDEGARTLHLDRVLVGTGELAQGVVEALLYDEAGDRYALAFSTATSPTQIYTIAGPDRATFVRHTRERILGVPEDRLASGEDASFTSFDGLHVSARLYLPAPALGFSGPRPLVYYVHGGPQGQERPNFAWFSMPLIQFLTLNGFAVFVPNVRGSTGYGLSYTKHVDHDWGGQDRLDHVHAMGLLAQDPRLDTKRAAVVGRSYGGYMTLTLAARHPDLWAAAVDMFGPYDLLTFIARLPETWKPYFYISVGDPEKDRAFLVERSPRTYIEQIACPLLVIQGANDPRVIERESRDVVEQLREHGKTVEYLMFPDEGHDVLKFANRVACYNGITDFFKRYLKP